MRAIRWVMAVAVVLLLGAASLFMYNQLKDAPVEHRLEPANGATEFAAEHRNVWGAMYFPHDAYNAWQIWAEYNRSQIAQDMRYARQLDLNAIRVFASYEYWRDNPQQFEKRFDHFLGAADQHDIRVLPVLFESIGAEPTDVNVRRNGIMSSFAIHSPSRSQYIRYNNAILKQDPAWDDGPDSPEAFTRWFSEQYGSDDRVLAVEIMNEPGSVQPRLTFVNAMLRAADEANPDATLTMGSKHLKYNYQYVDPALDVFQFHRNLPLNGTLDEVIQDAAEASETYGRPVWLTEWQRIRDIEPPQEDFPATAPAYPHRMLPNYETMADDLREAIDNNRIHGAFLWGLMLKPAYICKPRTMGRINGVFYPDGAVWDKDDAEAIAGQALNVTERQELPAGMQQIRQKHAWLHCR